MSDKLILIFAEGATEIEFYKAIIKRAHDLIGRPFECSFDWADIKGIGNYKEKALRKFISMKKKYKNAKIYAFLCIDSDVFKFSSRPPIDRVAVRKTLESNGAQKVTYIEADTSIEEWFLCDFEGVLDYLKLSSKTKRPKGKGQDALKLLFNSANKVYVKGGTTKGFIEKLNIAKIMTTNCEALKPLCQEVGLECTTICK